jgi:hypothetical protein
VRACLQPEIGAVKHGFKLFMTSSAVMGQLIPAPAIAITVQGSWKNWGRGYTEYCMCAMVPEVCDLLGHYSLSSYLSILRLTVCQIRFTPFVCTLLRIAKMTTQPIVFVSFSFSS